MTTTITHLVCPQCGATNRLPQERLDHHPTCGRCKFELMAARPVPLTDAVFDKFVAGTELPVLVDFWAPWCGPCKVMAPQFEQAARQMPRVRLAKVETDANPQASARNGIRSIPTMVLYRGGREIARKSGAVSSGELVQWVQTQLASI